jgi:glycosyltransferase involved in cell wall biosynthesis
VNIAYIAPYQGAGLIRSRPSDRNLSLAARVKIGLIAELLKNNGHRVDILAQGEVIEPHLKFYRAFEEPERFDHQIPIYYGSALPVRGLNGVWSALDVRRLFGRRHRSEPYDLVLIYNLKLPQIACARRAIRLRLPVVLQYEDDAFADVWGNTQNDVRSSWQRNAIRRLFKTVSACTAVSPYLLAQLPSDMPKLLLRGIVSEAIVKSQEKRAKQDWVVFSGTHERTQGIEQLIRAWRLLSPAGWEFHIAGTGPMTPQLHTVATGDRSIVFHGLLDKDENARLLCRAKIGMNPQDVTVLPGNVFAFKIVEYLAAGLHVVTTPRGAVESELEAGISYIPDNAPETIAPMLGRVISERLYERTAEAAALRSYGPGAVSLALKELIDRARAKASRSILPASVTENA